MSKANLGIRILFIASAWLAGSGVPAVAQDDWGDESDLPIEIHGFVEAAAAGRVVNDPLQPDDSLLGEARFRLDLAHYRDRAELFFKGDFVTDDIGGGTDIDIRRAAVLLRIATWLDVVAGRQVLTWGTGDLLFLNDLFPKDFVSFFVGRDDEFLKAPSNSVKAAFYSTLANLDVVWTPTFAPDDYITGERLSFYTPDKPGRTSASAMGAPLDAALPDKTWENGEFGARLYRNVGGYELAAYSYVGFWSQPTAVDTSTGLPTFAELAAYGASARGNFLGGVGNIEGVYYDSRDDRDGADPALPNSQIRALVGYERELVSDLAAGLQYYAEWTQDHDSLAAHAPAPEFVPEEVRHLLTLRLTQRLMQQTLTLSLFAFHSPNESDGYIRPVVTRDWSDSVAITIGGNVMWGDENTFFGQLTDNANVYLRVRYSF